MSGSALDVSKNGDENNGFDIPLPFNSSDPLATVINDLACGDNSKFKTFSGIDGIPHRASGIRYYKEKDPEHMRPQSAGRVHCEIFDISDVKQKNRYEIVISLAYSLAKSGKAIITAIDRQFNQHTSSWLIYFEWIELFTYDPMGARGHSAAEPLVLRRK